MHTHAPAVDEAVSHQQPSLHRPHNPGETCFCLRSISFWSIVWTTEKEAIRNCHDNSAFATDAFI